MGGRDLLEPLETTVADKMMGGMGMSPRKAMASEKGGESFGVPGYPGTSRAENPDRSAGIGMKPHMSDMDRAVKPSASMGRQMAPDHGKMHPSMDFDRGDSVA